MARDQTITIIDPNEFPYRKLGFFGYTQLQKDSLECLYDGHYWPSNRVFKLIVDQVIGNIPVVGLLVIAVMFVTKPLRKHQLRFKLGPVPPEKLLKALEKRYVLRDLEARSLRDTDDGKFDLSISEEWIADALLQLGRPEQALAHIQEARAIREKLSAADPGNAEKRRVLQMIKNREREAQARIGQQFRSVAGAPSPAEIDRVIEGAKGPFEERVKVLFETQH